MDKIRANQLLSENRTLVGRLLALWVKLASMPTSQYGRVAGRAARVETICKRATDRGMRRWTLWRDSND